MTSRFPRPMLTCLILLGALMGAPAALAHAHLVNEIPAANSSVSAPTELRLTFSEGVEAAFTKVSIRAADGTVIMISAIAADPNDHKVLIVTLTQPLPVGEYEVEWRAVSVDTHQSNGHYRFKVIP
ncbi:copper homeostasis periplasmic binding protein CopC [Pseudomonas sp. CR3202]|uniref:copper homeostasis periplasmic binding protein CopC n=1 Tax=Pseudomonas sp. CR3202 TaxID=3351532 RepID=UPI003BF0E2A3